MKNVAAKTHIHNSVIRFCVKTIDEFIYFSPKMFYSRDSEFAIYLFNFFLHGIYDIDTR